MVQVLSRVSGELVRSARLLVAGLVPLAAFMGLAHTTVVGGSSGAMTAAQVEERALSWVVVAVLWVLPAVVGAIGFGGISVRLAGSGPQRPLPVLGTVLLGAYVVAQVAVVWFDDAAVLAGSSVFALAILLSLLGWWAVDLVAVLTCLQLFRNKVTPRTALTIGALTAVFLSFEIAIYLPALIGSPELHDTVGLPPMILPVLWAVLGAVLWRTEARSQVPG